MENPIKVVVPVNFSPAENFGAPDISPKSLLALHFALTHVSGRPAAIYLFHVLENTSRDFRQLDHVNEEIVELMKKFVLTAIDTLRRRGVQCDIEQVYRRISHGKPVAEIMQMATGMDADLIVMGAPSSRAFRNFTNKVPCTVVLTKDKLDL